MPKGPHGQKRPADVIGNAVYKCFYNWVKVHKSMRVTPAMEARLAERVWTFEDLANRIDGMIAKPAGARGPYKTGYKNSN